MGADWIYMKDMAALLFAYYAEQLITRLKSELQVPVHCTATTSAAWRP